MDYFTWFDPHEERSRARGMEFRLANARQDGQEDILKKLVEVEESLFWQEVRGQLGWLARDTAEQAIMPLVRENFAEAKAMQQRIEREITALSFRVLEPIMMAKGADGGLTAIMAPANSDGDMGARISYALCKPFQFSLQLPPMKDFR